jgi:hypothetical protein
MTYPPPPPPGAGGQFPPPEQIQPYQPPQAYQPPQTYQPDNPYAAPYQQPPPYSPPQAYDYGYGNPYSQGYGPMLKPPTEGLSIAALVVSCVAVAGLCASGLGGLLGIVGAIMGHVAQRKISANGSSGRGMALAGIIVGWVATALALVALAFIIFAIASESDSSYDY